MLPTRAGSFPTLLLRASCGAGAGLVRSQASDPFAFESMLKFARHRRRQQEPRTASILKLFLAGAAPLAYLDLNVSLCADAIMWYDVGRSSSETIYRAEASMGNTSLTLKAFSQEQGLEVQYLCACSI